MRTGEAEEEVAQGDISISAALLLSVSILFIMLFKKSFALIKYDFTFLALTIVLSIKFLVSHNFVDSGLTIFCFVYIINIIYKHNLKL